jgi:hypothetical protein
MTSTLARFVSDYLIDCARIAARQYGVISRMGEVHRWLIGEQDDIIAPQEALR